MEGEGVGSQRFMALGRRVCVLSILPGHCGDGRTCTHGEPRDSGGKAGDMGHPHPPNFW